MSYIRLSVRSGGIYLRQKEAWQEIKFGNLFLYPSTWKREKTKEIELVSDPKNSTQKVFELLRKSSIKGLFSYLLGETKRIKDIEKSVEPKVSKLNATLNKLLEASFWKKISEPHITTFFERKDTHSKKSKFTTAPSLNLSLYSFSKADSTIQLLEKPLRNIISKNIVSLQDIHDFFKKNVIKSNEQKEEYQQLIKSAKRLIEELESEIPDANEKLKDGIKTALKRFCDKKPISKKVITLVEEICSLYKKNSDFLQKIKKSSYGKFSVFTDLNSTKQWINTEFHSIVRGNPAYIARVDFDIYLSEEAFNQNNSQLDCFSWDEVVDKLKNGPNIARWGEGGIVLIEGYESLDEMGCGYDQKDQIFMDIKSLRHAGMKVKKYEWEEVVDEKKKLKKVKKNES